MYDHFIGEPISVHDHLNRNMIYDFSSGKSTSLVAKISWMSAVFTAIVV
jgi:hypothetical protein